MYAIENNTSLKEPYNFSCRTQALDFIDFHILCRLEMLNPSSVGLESLSDLYKRANTVKSDLESVDRMLFAELRNDLKTRGLELKKVVWECIEKSNINTNKIGYDLLDDFCNGLICTEDLPEPRLELKVDMIYYQKTPARVIFELAYLFNIRQLHSFVDLGSGLGQSVILLSLLTGAKCLAVEYEPAYHAYAIHCASQLGVDDITFINADAREIDYPDDSVFYIYTSFEGVMLAEMLRIIAIKSQHTPIRLFTYGPCSSIIARENWLACLYGEPVDPYSLCEFISEIQV